MKKIVLCFLIFCSNQLFAMEELCCFVPVMNGIFHENGPIVELSVAQQSQLFKDLFEDIPVEKGELRRFELPNCDIETAWTFASCLTKHYEAQQNSEKAQKALAEHIQSLTLQEKIDLCNIANYTRVEPLVNSIVATLTHSDGKLLLSSMNPDVRKKIASVLIAQNRYDTRLLQKYSDTLREHQYTLEHEGIIARYFAPYKKRICYFDQNTNTVIETVKQSKKIYFFSITKATALLRALKRASTSLSWLYKSICKRIRDDDEIVIDVSNHDIKKIRFIDMGNDEKYFTVGFLNQANERQFLIIDINSKTVTSTILEDTVEGKDSIFLMTLHKYIALPDYTVRNEITGNQWNFSADICAKEIFLVNKQQIIRKKKEYKTNNGGSTRERTVTTLITCIDDTMRNFASNIAQDNLPLVVCTVMDQNAYRVALDEQEYREYEYLPSSCRTMIDALCIVTKEGVIGWSKGVVLRIHRAIFPWIKFTVVICACALPVGLASALLSHFCSVKTKDIADLVELLLKL